ncbi:uncharacterized protein LOC143022523 [Oratosquilla oratoria]|uniref:uncharacterized protein LOC143022523 n=1 Tax=Oratosquilla oratoria TaxID=337810 RepID=UPI003F773F79
MEDRKEEVQQDDREEGKGQEGELEEKLWEVEEFLVTLVDNGRSVVARKDNLPLLPRSTKDFTPFLTELALKNVSPLRKADPDLLRQGREWLTERLGGGKELELHCIWNPDYRDGIVQVDTLTFQPPSDDHGDGQSGGPPSPESLVMDLYSGWEEPTLSEEHLLEGEEPQHEEPPPLDMNLLDRSGQTAAVDDCFVTESCVAYEEPTMRDGSTVSSSDIVLLQEEEEDGVQPQASSQPSTVHPRPSGSSPQPWMPTHQGYITTGQPCPPLPNPVGSPSHPCPPPPLLHVPSSQGYASAFQSCVSPRFQAPLSSHQPYVSPPLPLVSLPHPHVSPTQQLAPLSSVHSCEPRSRLCSLPSRPSGVLAQQSNRPAVQPSHPPGVSPPSETCSSRVRSTSPCQASPKTTKDRYNFKGKKGPGRHLTHPQRPQGFTKEPLVGWHGALAATVTPVSGASGNRRQSSEVYRTVQETGLEVSKSQILSHREVRLYQQNLRLEWDDLEKRYSTSSSTDPGHRVLQSYPMDDRDVTVQHHLGWIAAYQEEMTLMDRQGPVNKVENDSLFYLFIFLFEMRCLRSMVGVTRLDLVRKEEVRRRTGVVGELGDMVDERVLGWFGHVERMSEERLVKEVWKVEVEGMNMRGQPRMRWMDGVKGALQKRNVC